jgi:integrase
MLARINTFAVSVRTPKSRLHRRGFFSAVRRQRLTSGLFATQLMGVVAIHCNHKVAPMATVRKRKWKCGGEEKIAWVADYFDQAGKRHIKTFDKKKEADAFLVDARHEVSQGTHTAESASITVAAAGELWIEQGQTDGLEASTVRQYRQHLDQHIKPFLGTLKLAELAPATVQGFRNTLVKNGRSQAMAKKIMVSLGSILAVAQSLGKVARNVVRERSRKTERKSGRQKKRLVVGVDIPTKDEIRAMLNAAAGRWRPLVVTAIFTGLRASELRGLTWSNVDLDARVIRVRQRADRWNTIGVPKSEAGSRDVPMAPMVINALREWKLACPKRKGVLDLVFPNGDGNVETLSNIYRRGLGAVQMAAGITKDAEHPKYGLHSLRHAAASLFIEQGFTPKRVQAIMGHSSIQVTFDIYGHLFPSPEGDQAAMEQMQARLIG